MDQLAAYCEADKPPPSPHKGSGQVEDPNKDTSVTPDSAQGLLLGTSSSVPADPARSEPSRQDVPTQASWPIPEGSQESSLFPPPRPPEEPYDTYLQRTAAAGCGAAPGLGNGTSVLSAAPGPVPIPTYEGPVRVQWGHVSTLLCLGYICLCPGTATHLPQRPGRVQDRAPPFQMWTFHCLRRLLLVYDLQPPLQASWAQWACHPLGYVRLSSRLRQEGLHLSGKPGLSPGPFCPSHFGNSARLPQASGDISCYQSLFRPLPRLSGHAVHWASFPENAVFFGHPVTPRLSAQVPCHVPCHDLGRRRSPLLSHGQNWLWVFCLQDFFHHLPSPLKSLLLPQAPSTSGPTAHKDTPAATAEPPDVQVLMDECQEAFLARMKDMFGAALPQPTVGPSVLRNTGSDALRQLGPSDDRETSWAQRKASSKRADGRSQTRSSSGGLSRNNAETPVPHPPLYADGHLRLKGREQTVPAPFVILALQMTAGESLTFIIAKPLLAHPPAIITVVLLPPPDNTIPGSIPLICCRSPSGMARRAARDHSLSPRSRSPSHTARRSYRGHPPSPRSRRTSLIASTATQHLGHPHLKPTGAGFNILGAHALGPLTAIAGGVITKRTNAFFVYMTTLLSLAPEMKTRTPHRIPLTRIVASRQWLSRSCLMICYILLNCLIMQIPTRLMMKRTLRTVSSLPQGSRQRLDCACSWWLGHPWWPL